MRLRRDLREHASDLAFGVDDERRALHAPVGLAVVLLLDPRPVGLGDRVVGVGEQRCRRELAEFFTSATVSGETPRTSRRRRRSRMSGRGCCTSVSIRARHADRSGDDGLAASDASVTSPPSWSGAKSGARVPVSAQCAPPLHGPEPGPLRAPLSHPAIDLYTSHVKTRASPRVGHGHVLQQRQVDADHRRSMTCAGRRLRRVCQLRDLRRRPHQWDIVASAKDIRAATPAGSSTTRCGSTRRRLRQARPHPCTCGSSISRRRTSRTSATRTPSGSRGNCRGKAGRPPAPSASRQAVQVHDLGPRRGEVARELLVRVVTRVDLGQRAR